MEAGVQAVAEPKKIVYSAKTCPIDDDMINQPREFPRDRF
jgi:hypothetical protein